MPRTPTSLACPTALLMGLTLSGCAYSPPAKQALTVEPALHIGHGGAVDLASGYVVQARQAEMQGHLEEALPWWDKASALAPRRVEIQHGRGLCLARLGRLKEGVVALREAAALAPDDARILNNLGHALKLLGERAEAETLFRAALTADPHHAQARYNLVMLERPDMSLALADAIAPATMPFAPQIMVDLPMPLNVQQAPNRPPLQQVSTTLAALSSDTHAPVAVISLSSAAVPDPQPAVSKMSVTLTGLTIEVFNGNGVTGAAKGLSRSLARHGVQASRIANMTRYDTPTTRIIYLPGKITQAQQLAQLLPASSELQEASAAQRTDMRADVRVVLGHNLPRTLADQINHADCAGKPECAEALQVSQTLTGPSAM